MEGAHKLCLPGHAGPHFHSMVDVQAPASLCPPPLAAASLD